MGVVKSLVSKYTVIKTIAKFRIIPNQGFNGTTHAHKPKAKFKTNMPKVFLKGWLVMLVPKRKSACTITPTPTITLFAPNKN